jgi:hypothetical protein
MKGRSRGTQNGVLDGVPVSRLLALPKKQYTGLKRLTKDNNLAYFI